MIHIKGEARLLSKKKEYHNLLSVSAFQGDRYRLLHLLALLVSY